MAVPFDLRKLEKTGEQVPIVEGVAQASSGTGGTGASHFSISENGTLIYFQGSATASVQSVLTMIDRKGVGKAIGVAADTLNGSPRFSPDGKHVAFVLFDGTNNNVHVYDLSGTSAARRLTFGGNNRNPIWSGDGQYILFMSDREGDNAIFWQRADGAGPAERLTKPEKGEGHIPICWIPNTQAFAFSAVKRGGVASLWTYSLKNRAASPIADAAASISFPLGVSFSPDGRWLAYQSSETGRYEIYVQPFPPTGAKYQISKGGSGDNHTPLWSPAGKELFYVNLTRLFSVSVQAQASFSFKNPVPLPIYGAQFSRSGVRTYDISPDGSQFISVRPPDANPDATRPAQKIQIVLNWFEELKQKVRAK